MAAWKPFSAHPFGAGDVWSLVYDSPKAGGCNFQDSGITYKAPVAGDCGFPGSTAAAAWVSVPGPLGSPSALVGIVADAWVAVPGPLGSPAILAELPMFSWVAVPGPLGSPAILAELPMASWVAVPGPLGSPAIFAQLDSNAWVAGPSPLGAPSVDVAQPVQGWTSIPSPLGAPSALGESEYYEVRGRVYERGTPVERTVRAHRRDTGELEGEAVSVGGKVRIPCAAVSREYYLVSLDLSVDAIDFSPPCINRVESVLADDTAWAGL